MQNLENLIKAVKTDSGIFNQFEIHVQIGSAMNSNDPNYRYESFKGNKTQVLQVLKTYIKLVQSEMFNDQYGFLAYLGCSAKDRSWKTTEIFNCKIEVRR